MLKIFIATVVLLVIVSVIATYRVSRPAFDEERQPFTPGIVDPSLALTFARSASGLILVNEHRGDSIVGIDLTKNFGERATRDLFYFLDAVDLSTLTDITGETESFSLDSLLMPVDYAFPYIAAGTNFKEHAEEVYSDDPPFLFPKLAEAGNWQEPVPFTKRLDFEAELGMFPLEDINSTDELPAFGLVLGNDFTDRWKLVTGLNLKRPLGETGFAAGKGCSGCMPTGYLVVIPQSAEFYKTLEVSLYVNDQLRQRFALRDLILPIEDIVSQAFDQRHVNYDNDGASVSLLPEDHIPRGTLILTGTAAGVIFKPLNIWHQGFYLQPGDVVRTEATFLGHLENIIEATD